MKAKFLRHEGFLGAVGAFLKVHPMTPPKEATTSAREPRKARPSHPHILYPIPRRVPVTGLGFTNSRPCRRSPGPLRRCAPLPCGAARPAGAALECVAGRAALPGRRSASMMRPRAGLPALVAMPGLQGHIATALVR